VSQFSPWPPWPSKLQLLRLVFLSRLSLPPEGMMFFSWDSAPPAICSFLSLSLFSFTSRASFGSSRRPWPRSMMRPPTAAVQLPSSSSGLTCRFPQVTIDESANGTCVHIGITTHSPVDPLSSSHLKANMEENFSLSYYVLRT